MPPTNTLSIATIGVGTIAIESADCASAVAGRPELSIVCAMAARKNTVTSSANVGQAINNHWGNYYVGDDYHSAIADSGGVNGHCRQAQRDSRDAAAHQGSLEETYTVQILCAQCRIKPASVACTKSSIYEYRILKENRVPDELISRSIGPIEEVLYLCQLCADSGILDDYRYGRLL